MCTAAGTSQRHTLVGGVWAWVGFSNLFIFPGNLECHFLRARTRSNCGFGRYASPSVRFFVTCVGPPLVDIPRRARRRRDRARPLCDSSGRADIHPAQSCCFSGREFRGPSGGAQFERSRSIAEFPGRMGPPPSVKWGIEIFCQLAGGRRRCPCDRPYARLLQQQSRRRGVTRRAHLGGGGVQSSGPRPIGKGGRIIGPQCGKGETIARNGRGRRALAGALKEIERARRTAPPPISLESMQAAPLTTRFEIRRIVAEAPNTALSSTSARSGSAI